MHLPTALLQHFLDSYGYLAVYVFVALESTGVPFPGETMLITAAIYAGTGHLSIPLVVGSAAAGAICGDNFGYTLGRLGLRNVVLRFGRYVRLDAEKLARAEAFFARHGDKTIFFGRFVAILRTYNAFLAGINRMPWPKFFVFDASGAICWATLYGTLAFQLGKNLPLLHRVFTVLGMGGVALAAAVIAALFILHRRARRVEHHMVASMEQENQPAARPESAEKSS